MVVKTNEPTVYNGEMNVEVVAGNAEEALAKARAIPGLTLHDDFAPIPMGGGTFIVSGTAKDVSAVPEGVTFWPKTKHQHCNCG